MTDTYLYWFVYTMIVLLLGQLQKAQLLLPLPQGEENLFFVKSTLKGQLILYFSKMFESPFFH